jgi:hypothetical protein
MAFTTSGWVQGKFTPKNPEKYSGDLNNIVFRSSWELEFAMFLDNNINVLQWSSEEIHIPYYNPVKKRVARYYPDFLVKFKHASGEIVTEMIEIKPSNQVSRPTGKNAAAQQVWAQNICKWEAAIKYCQSRSIHFRVLTEHSIFSR